MFDFLFVPVDCYREGVLYFLLHILFFYRKMTANLTGNLGDDKGNQKEKILESSEAQII